MRLISVLSSASAKISASGKTDAGSSACSTPRRSSMRATFGPIWMP
jgi:hypothetical protein